MVEYGTVDTLYIGDFPQSPGTYGAAGSGADNVDSRFTGAGVLTVLSLGEFTGSMPAEFTDIQVNEAGDVTLIWDSQSSSFRECPNAACPKCFSSPYSGRYK